MIGPLRFVGLLNATVWLGAGLFFYAGASPAMGSDAMLKLIGSANFAYYSGAILGLLEVRYLYVQLVCSIIALVHLGAEWVYLGKYPRRTLGFLLLLFFFALAEVAWVAPRVRLLHVAAHAVNLHPEQRAAAARSSKWWQGISHGLGWVTMLGVGVYLWRITIPVSSTRFVTPPKLHS